METNSSPVSVVSGANSGIGLEVVAGLRQAGHHVIMACRSAQRCAAAKAELDGRRLPGSCECAQLNLSDFGSIRAFAKSLDSRQNVSVLVNNAGVMGLGPGPDGGNAHLLPNHLGPFLLTRLVLPLMAPHGRVVTVGSEAHRRAAPRGSGSLTGPSSGNWYMDYARSKLCNLLMTAELSRRLTARHSSVTASCVSPGRVNTHIFANVPGLLRPPLQLLAGLLFQTPQQGARTVLKAALAPELTGKHTLYLHNMQGAEPAVAARDATSALNLWEHSVQAVGLSLKEDARLWPAV